MGSDGVLAGDGSLDGNLGWKVISLNIEINMSIQRSLSIPTGQFSDIDVKPVSEDFSK